MNRILKNSFSGIAILTLFFLTVSQIGTAEEAIPLLPMTVKGVAMINGDPAPNGTLVAAYLDGQPIEKLLVNSSSGDYCFWISGTAQDEGKPVTFSVDGKVTENSVSWESGKQVLSFDLSVGTGADPVNSIKNLNLKFDLGTLTEIGKLKAFGQNSETKIIESSVPEPDLEALKSIKVNSGDKGSAKSSEGSSKLNSTPGFPVIYAVAGIVGLALGSSFREKSRRKR
jgi:hypothetical protein